MGDTSGGANSQGEGEAGTRCAVPPTRSNVICGVLVLACLALFAAQGLFEDGALREIQDHVITHSFSRQVVEHHVYASDFQYPLPAVLFKLAFAALGMGLSSVLWSALSIAAAWSVILASIELLGLRGSGRALFAPALAFLVLRWCVQWDLRAVNVNLVFLGLVLWGVVEARRQHWLVAGLWLAASTVLKLYSAPLLLYLVWRGHWRAALSTAAALCVFFVLVPIAWLGWADAVELTGLWLANLRAALDPGYVAGLTAYKVSLQWVGLALLADPAAAGRAGVAVWTVERVRLAVASVQLIALAGVVVPLLRRDRREADAERWLAEVGLILAAMLLLSPIAQPHHGVVLIAPVALLAARMLDADLATRSRVAAGSLLLGIALGLELAPSGPWRGLALNVVILALIFALPVLTRCGSSRRTPPSRPFCATLRATRE